MFTHKRVCQVKIIDTGSALKLPSGASESSLPPDHIDLDYSGNFTRF